MSGHIADLADRDDVDLRIAEGRMRIEQPAGLDREVLSVRLVFALEADLARAERIAPGASLITSSPPSFTSRPKPTIFILLEIDRAQALTSTHR